MIVDTSAIIAVLRNEPEAASIMEVLQRESDCRMSAVTYAEAGIVTDGSRNPVLSRRLDDLLRDFGIRIESVTPEQARLARQAYFDFGKGRHKAALNLGDCFAYALAKEANERLLFKGDDFRQTDIESVLS
ncbi:MAG TPA: type II toxin-antitoxin system VapC family toxin [Candidatus Sulfotelmatobacter sp.]|nr:type II toxin-antitoxin system VapC family toxin [Candidatus Sulfotelmatobacter sp.]